MRNFHIGVTGTTGFSNRMMEYMDSDDKSVTAYPSTGVLRKCISGSVKNSLTNIDNYTSNNKKPMIDFKQNFVSATGRNKYYQQSKSILKPAN
jgi:hypothetical protein